VAIAHALLNEGARVAKVDLAIEAEQTQALSGRTIALRCDVSAEQEVDDTVAMVER